MKLILYFFVLAFSLMSCTTDIPGPPAKKPVSVEAPAEKPVSPSTNLSVSENKSKIIAIQRKDYYDYETIESSIEKIYKTDSTLVYKSGMKNGTRNEVELAPGEHRIQFRCDNGGKYNYNWVTASLEPNHTYFVYCLKETRGKNIVGADNIVSFFPFISTPENLEKDTIANQKIVDTPSQAALDKDVEQGKTRLIIYNAKTSIFGTDFIPSYKVSINGSSVGTIESHKYLSIDLKNGEADVEISFVDAFTFKKSVKVDLNGGIKYLECTNGIMSASIEVKRDMPEGFKKSYKPQYPFKSK